MADNRVAAVHDSVRPVDAMNPVRKGRKVMGGLHFFPAHFSLFSPCHIAVIQ